MELDNTIITLTIHDDVDTKTIQIPKQYLQQIPCFRCIFDKCSEEADQDHITMRVPTVRGVWQVLSYWNLEWKRKLEETLANNFLMIPNDITYLKSIIVPESEFPSLMRIIELFEPCVETVTAFNNNLPKCYDLSSISTEFLTGAIKVYQMAFLDSMVIKLMYIDSYSKAVCNERIACSGMGSFCSAYSADKRRIAYDSSRIGQIGGVTIIDASGRILHHINSEAYRIIFSPDGKHFVSCGIYHGIDIIDIESGTIVASNRNYEGLCVAYSPDGNHVALGCQDNNIRICCSQTGNIIRTLTGYHRWSRSLCYSPDGKSLVVGGDDGTIMIWSLTSTTSQSWAKVLRGHTHGVHDVKYTPDGSKIISRSDSPDNTIRIWNAVTGVLLNTFTHVNTHFMLDPSGKQIICGEDDHIDIIDIESGSVQVIQCQMTVGDSLDCVPVLDVEVRKLIEDHLTLRSKST